MTHDSDFPGKSDQTDEGNDNLLENGNGAGVIEEGSDFVESKSVATDDDLDDKRVSTRKKRVDVKSKKRSKEKLNTNSPWICQICDKKFSGELHSKNNFTSPHIIPFSFKTFVDITDIKKFTMTRNNSDARHVTKVSTNGQI